MKFFLEEDINCIFDSLKNKSNKLSGKNILISGGAGFLGTYFVQVINKFNERKIIEDAGYKNGDKLGGNMFPQLWSK